MTFPLGAAAVTQQPDAGEPLIRWDWLARHLDDIAVRTFEHIQLTAIAVGVGLVVSLALGLVAVRFRWTATPIGWFSGALYAIPSLAFFGLLIPFSGFSIFTAEIALVAYTLSTLVRNVIAGLDGVPPPPVLQPMGSATPQPNASSRWTCHSPCPRSSPGFGSPPSRRSAW